MADLFESQRRCFKIFANNWFVFMETHTKSPPKTDWNAMNTILLIEWKCEFNIVLHKWIFCRVSDANNTTNFLPWRTNITRLVFYKFVQYGSVKMNKIEIRKSEFWWRYVRTCGSAQYMRSNEDFVYVGVGLFAFGGTWVSVCFSLSILRG